MLPLTDRQCRRIGTAHDAFRAGLVATIGSEGIGTARGVLAALAGDWPGWVDPDAYDAANRVVETAALALIDAGDRIAAGEIVAEWLGEIEWELDAAGSRGFATWAASLGTGGNAA